MMNTSHPTLQKVTFQKIIEAEISEISDIIGVKKEILNLWISQHHLEHDISLLSLIHMVKKYQLDPLAEEISVLKNSDGTKHTFITIDGWNRIINQHPQYAGITLKESLEEQNSTPIWMECCIYRHDRILPIVVKEYFNEVKTDHIIWQQAPRRMLRHRAIQQCARLAFGLSSPEFISKNRNTQLTTDINTNNSAPLEKNIEKLTRVEKLKKVINHSIEVPI